MDESFLTKISFPKTKIHWKKEELFSLWQPKYSKCKNVKSIDFHVIMRKYLNMQSQRFRFVPGGMRDIFVMSRSISIRQSTTAIPAPALHTPIPHASSQLHGLHSIKVKTSKLIAKFENVNADWWHWMVKKVSAKHTSSQINLIERRNHISISAT